jgi:hypothetical protein
MLAAWIIAVKAIPMNRIEAWESLNKLFYAVHRPRGEVVYSVVWCSIERIVKIENSIIRF